MGAKLPRCFYERDAVTVARALLGKLLVHCEPQGRTSAFIVETEAYMGPEDRAAHSFGGRITRRTRAMYGPAGHAYVFMIYGMYECFNVVTGPPGSPQAVLVRALEPHEGIELMAKRRKSKVRNLTNGPGKLTRAMNISRRHYGMDLCGEELFIEEGVDVAETDIVAATRINVDYAGEWKTRPWRFYIRNSPFVSVR